MKDELTFEDLISDLQENGVETSVKGGFKFTEMLHEDSQKLMKIGSTSAHIEIPAKVANLFTEFIEKSVEFEEDVVKIAEYITTDIKPLLLNELRRLTLGDLYVDDDGVEYTLREVTNEDFKNVVKPTVIKFNKFGIRLSAPTLEKERTLHNRLISDLQPFRNKKQMKDSDYGEIADLYQNYEIMKYITEIDCAGATYDFEASPKNKKIKLIASLPQKVIADINEYIELVKENEKKACTIINNETKEEEQIDMNTLFFVRNSRKK
jgi:hypothetical protein